MPTFLQTCKLQAKKLTSSSKTLSFFKGIELLELDLGIFQAIDVRVSVEMPWRPAVPTDKDRKSTIVSYCGYCEICPRQPQVYLYSCAVTSRPAPPLLSHACRRPLAFRKWILAHQLAASGGATPNPNASDVRPIFIFAISNSYVLLSLLNTLGKPEKLFCTRFGQANAEIQRFEEH